MIEEGGKALAAYLKPREERSEEHTSELQSQSNLVCRLLLEKKKETQLLVATIPRSSGSDGLLSTISGFSAERRPVDAPVQAVLGVLVDLNAVGTALESVKLK